MHANLHPDEIRLSIRLLFQLAIGDEAVLEDAPDRITLMSDVYVGDTDSGEAVYEPRTVTLRRVYRATANTSTVPGFRPTLEANYGTAGARDTDTARRMFIDRGEETINVTLSPRGNDGSPGRPPDRVTGGFLDSDWPSVDWQYTRSAGNPLLVDKSQARFRKGSEDPWELGPVISLTDPAPSGRNTFPPSSFGPGNPPWGTLMVQVRTAYDYDGDIRWSDWSRDRRFEYLPPAPRLTPLEERLRVEVEPRAGYGSHEVRYETYSRGAYSYSDDGFLDLGSSTVGVIPDLRGGAGYEVQVRYSDGDEYSEWSEPARANPLRPRQTFRFMAVFVEEELPSGRSRAEGFGPDQRVWPGSDFTPQTYGYNFFDDYSVTALQWGNRQNSFSPSTLGLNDLLIFGEGHSSRRYASTSIHPQAPRPIPDDQFEVVIDGRSYGRTESLFLTRLNVMGFIYASDYIRGIRDVADELRANVPLNIPVTVEFRYGEGR